MRPQLDRHTQATLTAWLYLALLVGAVASGTLGYLDAFNPYLVWWRWISEVAAGWVLLIVALGGGARSAEAPVRRWLRYAAAVFAAIATAIAIREGLQPGHELAAGAASLVAIGAFLAARWVPFSSDDVRCLTGDPADAANRSPHWIWSIGLGTLAVAANVVAAYYSATKHLEAFLLWLVSLALFAAAMWRRGTEQRDEVPCAWHAEGGSPRGGSPLSRQTEVTAVLLILALALALRVVMLADFPLAVHQDEGNHGRSAEALWHDGFPHVFGYGWNAFPNMSFLAGYVGIQALGPGRANLRLGSALMGVLSLIPVFFWARRWWGSVVALLALLLLAINREHIYWSRGSLNNIQQVLVAGLMLVAFARVLRTRRPLDWVWLGYATGLGFYSYHAAKLFPALLLVIGILFAVGIRGFVRRYAPGMLIGVLAFLLLCGPLMLVTYREWDFVMRGMHRIDVDLLIASLRAGNSVGARLYIADHVWGCLMAFVTIPYNEAIFQGPEVCVLFLLGIGWMLWRWRDPRHLVVLVWTLGILLIGGMITVSPPNKARMIGFLPTVVIVPAVLVGRIRAALRDCLSARSDTILIPVLIGWFGLALYHNWYAEFVHRPMINRGEINGEVCHLIDKTPLPATFYMAGIGYTGIEPNFVLNVGMYAPNPDRTVTNLSDDAAIVPIRPGHRGNAVLLVAPDQQGLLPLVRHYYPDARYEIIDFPDGAPVLHVFTLSAHQIERHRGLHVTFRSPTRTWSAPEAQESLAAVSLAAAADVEFPLEASGRGQVWIASPGAYAFRSRRGTLSIDGEPTNGESPLPLAGGWHTIAMTATLQHARDVVVPEWQQPGAAVWAPIPRNFLNTHAVMHGLLGRYFRQALSASTSAPIAAEPDYTEIDPAISFDWRPDIDEKPPPVFAARPSTMEWTGSVDIPEGESHTLRLEATTRAQVFLDGKLVLNAQTDGAPPVEVILTDITGTVPILVRAVRPADDNIGLWKLRLLWSEAEDSWTAFARYHPADNPADLPPR